MMTNGYLERFQKRRGREEAKTLLREQAKILLANLGKVEAYQVGLVAAGKTSGPEWDVVEASLKDGEEKLDWLKHALAEIEAQEVAEKVTDGQR